MAPPQVQYNGYEMNLPRALDAKNRRLRRQPKQRIWAEKKILPTFDIQNIADNFWENSNFLHKKNQQNPKLNNYKKYLKFI